MPTERRDTAAFQAALDEALGELPDDIVPGGPGPADRRWLGAGLRLGLDQPGRARRLLELLEDVAADPASTDAPEPASTDTPERAPGPNESGGPALVPARSSLLARSAGLPSSELASLGPEVRFGFAAGLTPDQVLSLGRVVGEMLAEGGSPNLGRGFGIAWDGGARLPRRDLEALLHEFTELEVTVGGVLAGRELRTVGEPEERPGGLGALFGSWVPRKDPGETQAAAAIDRRGQDARLGLVALWNAWMAMRYRSLVPSPVFELLVRPWVSVVGPLPEP